MIKKIIQKLKCKFNWHVWDYECTHYIACIRQCKGCNKVQNGFLIDEYNTLYKDG